MKKPDKFFLDNRPVFIIGAVKEADIPLNDRQEFAFVGRSNVGKSSLINAITNSKAAITSKTPGRTKQLNFFNIGNELTFVDMPGYGYAKTGRREVENWTELIFKYLLGRVNLKRLFLLIDSRRGLKDNDLAVMEVLDKSGVVYQIVLTKADEIKPPELEKVIASIDAVSRKHPAMFPEILSTSSNRGDGISDLRAVIYDFAGIGG